MSTTTVSSLPIPTFFDGGQVGEWKWVVPYQERFEDALGWAKQHGLSPAATDSVKIGLMPIDTQLTFCHPDFELYVGGRSGTGAIDDNRRLCEFIYRNLGQITRIHPTLDTHMAAQIFHPVFWVNEAGDHPAPATIITLDEVKDGTWKVNPAVTFSVTGDARKYSGLQQYALHYVQKLSDGGKFPLMIWPFHAMLGGHGHALVPSVEEAIFFHNVARSSQTDWQIKGGNPLTENYSVLAPEVTENQHGNPIGQKNAKFIESLLQNDAVIVAGQAKSHCVAWTVRHLLDEIAAKDPALAGKVYLMVDCMSPVVIPNVIDFTDQADQQFADFEQAGMKLVKSTDPIETWPGMKEILGG